MSRFLVRSVLLLFVAVPAFAGLNLPSDLTVEATQPGGAIVDYNASVTGTAEDENGRPLVSANCSPAPHSLFPIGTTTVTCTGSDGSRGSFNVRVVDSVGPKLQLPRDFALFAPDDSGVIATFDASASDSVDGKVAVSCSPASGSKFPIGTTTVDCSATDTQGNSARGFFEIIVYRQSSPPPPPPEQVITVEATGPRGAVVTFTSSTNGPDDFNGRPAGACNAASGSLFPLGTTIVVCSDFTFKINVVDTTAPALSLPGNITQADAVVMFKATASDIVDGNVDVYCTPPSGSTFVKGSTTVNCSATDSHFNSASGSFVVEVTGDGSGSNDTTPPDFLSISATPNVLTPPNNEMREVTVRASVHDDVDPAPVVRIFNVTSNEKITSADWQITGLMTLTLRASRDGSGSGRVYTIHVEVTDASGNRRVETVTVSVTHDQSTSSPATAPPPSKRRSVRG